MMTVLFIQELRFRWGSALRIKRRYKYTEGISIRSSTHFAPAPRAAPVTAGTKSGRARTASVRARACCATASLPRKPLASTTSHARQTPPTQEGAGPGSAKPPAAISVPTQPLPETFSHIKVVSKGPLTDGGNRGR